VTPAAGGGGHLAWIGDRFVDKDNNKVDAATHLYGYKMIIVLYTADWWPGCKPFKEALKESYLELNKEKPKSLQVVILSGDRDMPGYKKTINGMPWIAVKHGEDDLLEKIGEVVECTGYPTPGIINGLTGAVINADAHGRTDTDSLRNVLAYDIMKEWWKKDKND